MGDVPSGDAVAHALRGIDEVAEEGTTAIVATHDPLMIEVADRVVELRDGHREIHR